MEGRDTLEVAGGGRVFEFDITINHPFHDIYKAPYLHTSMLFTYRSALLRLRTNSTFTDEKTEAQRLGGTSPRSHS